MLRAECDCNETYAVGRGFVGEEVLEGGGFCVFLDDAFGAFNIDLEGLAGACFGVKDVDVGDEAGAGVGVEVAVDEGEAFFANGDGFGEVFPFAGLVAG